MAEYIEKNRLILSMNDWMLQNAPVKAGDDTTRADTILDAIKLVEDSPAADVRENVEGEWELDNDGLPVCSRCGEIALQRIFVKVPHLIQDVRMVRSRWCPACGAQMMGGAEDG